MMEILKRHAFLLSLAGGVVVISAAAIVAVYLLYVRPSAATRTELATTARRANELFSGNVFTPKLVEWMEQNVKARQKQYEELLSYTRKLGADRAPLVKDVFPQGNDIARTSFKAAYDAQLAKFMKRLGAKRPAGVGPDGKAESSLVTDDNLKATLYADPKVSFFRPDWVDKQEVPDMALVRFGQENLWLMEDIVEILARMNEDAVKADKLEAVIKNVPVKELIEIRIGSDYAVIAGGKMTTLPGRYRPTAAAAAKGLPGLKGDSARAPTVSARYSQPRFYQVLPFRLIVAVDARYAGELVRRLRGRETFITVEAWRVKPITETTLEKAGGLLAPSREDYGPHAVVRLEVVAESLAFQLEEGRATTVPEKKAPAAKEAAAKSE